MDERGGFVQKILFIHTVFIYTGCVHFVPFGGRKFDRRNEVLAETGGAVSALTPREHTVLRQQNNWQQAAERYASWCSFTRGDAYERSGFVYPYPETHCCSPATA